MAKKERPAGLTIRLRENTWKVLEHDMKKDGLPSINAAIQRRLDRTLIDENIQGIMDQVAEKTAKRCMAELIDYITKLQLDHKNERAELEGRIYSRDQLLDISMAFIKQLKGDSK
jgi:hypothetical protein